MVLNEGQAEAVEKIAQRYKDGKSFAVLAGPAGSGKTTTVAAIIAALPDVDPEKDVVYCAYTGRAT
jgi:excinuclease UvrABC helicase subunit UvrB